MKRFMLPASLLLCLLAFTSGQAAAKTVKWGDFQISVLKGWKVAKNSNDPDQLMMSTSYKGRRAVIVIEKKPATKKLSQTEYKVWLTKFDEFLQGKGYGKYRFYRRSNLPLLDVKKCPVAVGEKDGLRYFNFVPYSKGKVRMIVAAVEITPKSRGIPKFLVAALKGIQLPERASAPAPAPRGQPGQAAAPKAPRPKTTAEAMRPKPAAKAPEPSPAPAGLAVGDNRKSLAAILGVPKLEPVSSPPYDPQAPGNACQTADTPNRDGFGFQGLKKELTAGQELWLGYNRPEEASGAIAALYRLGQGGARIWVRTYKLNKERRGMIAVALPAAPGCYQFAMYQGKRKEGKLLAASGFRLNPDPERPLPRLALNRAVFAPSEYMALRVRGEKLGQKAWVATVKADTPQGTHAGTARYQVGHKELAKQRNGILDLSAPDKPGEYQLRLYDSYNLGAMPLAELNFQVKEPRWTGKPLLGLGADTYEVGQPFSVVFNAMPDWQPKSWIGLIPAGSPHGDSATNDKYDISYVNLRKRKVGTAKFSAPKKPGLYELRMIGGPATGEGRKEVALARIRCVLPSGYDRRKLSLRSSRKSYEAWENMEVTFTARRDWPSPWIGLVPRGTPLDAAQAYKAKVGGNILGDKDEGEMSFSAPAKPGAYELRMYPAKREVARPTLSLPIRVSPRVDEAKSDARAAAAAEKALEALPDYESLAIDPNRFQYFFRVPSIPLVTGQAGSRADAGPCLPCTAAKPLMLADNSRTPHAVNSLYTIDDRQAPGFAVRLVSSKADTACIDREIELMRKLDVTLGRDNQFAESLVNLAQTFATKWTLPVKSGEEINQAINLAVDTYNHGGAAIEAMQKGEYSEAVLQSMTTVLKTLVTSCRSEACFKAISKSADETLVKYLKTLPPGARSKFIAQAKAALGNDKFIADLHGTMGSGMTVDTGATAVELRSGDYRRAIWTFTSSAVQIHPVGAMVLATGKAGYEGMRAARDMIVDSSTRDLYSAYKKAYGPGGRDAEAVYAGLSRGYAYPYEKVRRMMLANPTNPLVRQAMSQGNRLRALGGVGKGLQAEHISQEEIDGFLKLQFKTWMDEERTGSDFSRYAQGLKNDYAKMECPHALFKKLDEERKKKSNWQQLKDRASDYMDGTCQEGKRFAAYAKLRGDIDAEMNKWGQGKACKGTSLRRASAKLACVLLEQGPEHYQRQLGQLANQCGWRPKVEYWAEVNYGNKLAQLAKSEKKVSKIMERIGRKDVLNCLCRHSRGIVSAGYHPQKTKGQSPSCDNGSGACIGGSFGCLRFPMKTGGEYLKACGAYKAVVDYKKSRQVKR